MTAGITPCIRARRAAVAALALSLALAAGPTPAEDLDPFAASWRLADGARLEALDKVTGRISVVEAASGAPVAFGTLDIIVETCHERPPELPPDSAALLTISETRDSTAPARTLFHGWMFASSPGLSALEHPVYDVIVLECLHLAEEPEEPEEPQEEGQAQPGDADQARLANPPGARG